MAGSRVQRLAFAGVMMLTVALGARGITDEASVLLGGDMARYVMDGVFLHDLIGSGGAWNHDDLIRYAEHYFARYPALSLGHHPPLPYVALVPFLAVFGVSLFTARLAALTFFLLATWGLYALSKRTLGWQAASWAALLFVTNLYVLRAGQYLLSEMPMLVFILAALIALFVYCDTQKAKYLAWFVMAAAASLYGKQLAVFMFPIYGLVLVTQLGWRSLLRRHVIVLTLIGIMLVAPLVVMTIALSPANVAIVAWATTGLVTGTRHMTIPAIVTAILRTHLSLPTMFVVIAGAIALILGRNRKVAIAGLAWILVVVGGAVIFAGGVEPARYSFGAMPAYCFLAAGLVVGAESRMARWTAVIVLSSCVLWQSWIIRNVRPSGAGGYEAAAEYVVAESREPAVLFDSAVDTGYFVFFVRKHDELGRLLILRADKLMTMPGIDRTGPRSRISTPAEIYDLLKKFGVQFVVVEERDKGPQSLRLLHAELKTDRFVERQRIPIVSLEPAARGKDIVIYEFKDAGPADPEAELDIDIPKGNREIRIRMKDMVGGIGRRSP